MRIAMYIVLALLLYSVISQGQTFSMIENAGQIIVNVPNKYKAYTYSKFQVTDTSVIITGSRESFDLIIRNPNTKQNLIFQFPPSPTSRIKSKNDYNLKTGEPVIFTVNADEAYHLRSSMDLAIEFVVDEFGNLCNFSSLPTDKNFCLSPNRTFGFKYIPSKVGSQIISLSLFQDSIEVENREIPIEVSRNDIKLWVETNIHEYGFDKIINYKIISSEAVPSDLSLNLTLNIEQNGFRENIHISNILKQGEISCSGAIRKTISGRRPRSFLVTNYSLSIKNTNSLNAVYTIN